MEIALEGEVVVNKALMSFMSGFSAGQAMPDLHDASAVVFPGAGCGDADVAAAGPCRSAQSPTPITQGGAPH